MQAVPSSRRVFLRFFGLGAAATLIAACTPSPAAPTAAPTAAPKPPTAPAPTTAPAPAAQASPAAAPAAAASPVAAASPAAQPATAASPAAQAAPAQARNLGKLVVAEGTAPPDPTCHFFYYALDQGFYKDEGLDVTISPFNGDLTAIRAMIAGEADVCWAGIVPGLQAYQSGTKLKGVNATAPKLDYLLVVQQEIKSPKDLEGKNVAVSQPGAVSYQVPKMMVEGDGGDSSKVNWLSVGGSSARVQALIAKKADGAVLNASFATRTKQYDYLHSVGDAAQALPDYIYSWETALDTTIAQKRDALQAYVNATLRGARWGMQNPDKAAAITQKTLPDQPAAELAAGIQAFAQKTYWNPDGALTQKAFDFTVNESVKSGDLKQPIKYGDIVMTDFDTAAVAKLGPYKP